MYWLGMTRGAACDGRMSWNTDSKIAPGSLVAPYQAGTIAPTASRTGEKRFCLAEEEKASPVSSRETRQSGVPADRVVRIGESGDRFLSVAATYGQSSDSDA